MAQRLPIPGSDDGAWGTILNGYLEVAHNADGTLQTGALTQAGAVTSINSVNPVNGVVTLAPSDIGAGTYSKPAGGIPASDLSSGVQNDLTLASSAMQPGNSATGDLSGTYPGPTVAKIQGTAVDPSTPSDTQVLTYSAAAGKWVPGTISSTTVNDATTSSKGIVELANDLSGTATAPTVVSTNLASALPVNQGGTGSTSQNFVDLTTSQTVAGIKTFSSGVAVAAFQVTGSSPASGRVLTSDSSGNATWQALPSAPVTSVAGRGGAVTLTTADLTNVNITSPANNQVLAYNSLANQWVNQTPSSAPNATSSAPGLVQLTGDLGGSATDPTVNSVLGGKTPEQTDNKDQPNGYAGLDGNGLLKTAELPAEVVIDSAASPIYINSTGATNGQALIYNSTASEWLPGSTEDQLTSMLGTVFPGYRYVLPASATSSAETTANACVVDSNGNTIIVGELFAGSTSYLGMVRLTSELIVDLTFGNQGWCLIQVASSTGMAAQGLALQADGNILVSGIAIVSGVESAYVARVTTAGILDTSFNTTGYNVFQATGAGQSASFGVRETSDGHVIAVGSTVISSVKYQFATRLTSAGIIDTTYGTSGYTTWNAGNFGNGAAWNVLEDSSGNAVIGGAGESSFSTTIATGTGSENTSGQKTINVASTGSTTPPSGIVVGAAVSIGTGGTTEATNTVESIAGTVLTLKNNLTHNHSSGDPVVAAYDILTASRLTPGGALDTTFNSTGYNAQCPGIGAVGLTVGLQSSGEIIVGGNGFVTEPQPVVMRFNTNGSLDTTFGTSGYAALPYVGGVNALVVDSSNRIMLGNVSSTRATWCARLTANGSLDTTFDGTGNMTSTAPMFTPNGIAMTTDGSGDIILAGTGTPTSGIQSYGVSRVTTDGQLEYGFPSAAQLGADPAGTAVSETATETARAEAAEALLAPLASPALTGTPTTPTASNGTDTTQIATTQFVQTAISLGGSNALELVYGGSSSPGSSVTPNLTSSNAFSYSLTANLTISNPTNVSISTTELILSLTQDSTGGRTVTLGNQFISTPTLYLGPNAQTVWRFVNIGSTTTPSWQPISIWPDGEASRVVGATGQPAFNTNWSAFPAYMPIRFWLDSAGAVHLQGGASISTLASAPATVFTLPSGYIPTVGVALGWHYSASGNIYTLFGYVTIAGAVVVNYAVPANTLVYADTVFKLS